MEHANVRRTRRIIRRRSQQGKGKEEQEMDDDKVKKTMAQLTNHVTKNPPGPKHTKKPEANPESRFTKEKTSEEKGEQGKGEPAKEERKAKKETSGDSEKQVLQQA